MVFAFVALNGTTKIEPKENTQNTQKLWNSVLLGLQTINASLHHLLLLLLIILFPSLSLSVSGSHTALDLHFLEEMPSCFLVSNLSKLIGNRFTQLDMKAVFKSKFCT